MLGKAIAGRRDEIVLATKFGLDMQGANGPDWGVRGSRRYVRLAVESSLRRLGTDWIDLYQMHRPDPVTPIEETLSVLDDLVREGKIRYVGHSNFAGWQIAEAELTASIAGTTQFVSAQNEYSPLAPCRRGRGPACRPGLRPRVPAVLPAVQRPAHGQVHEGGRPRGRAAHHVEAAAAGDAPWTCSTSSSGSATRGA